jgi:hypothetical protein
MKRLKKLLRWFFILLILIPLVGISLFFVFKKDIEKLGIKTINEQITVPFKVSDYKVSLWKTFPNLSFTVFDLEIEESEEVFKRPLFEAKEVHLVFNIWKVIGGEFEIQKLKVSTATARIATGKIENFNILPSKEKQDSSAFNLESLEIANLSFLYAHNKHQLSIQGKENDLLASIEMNGDEQKYFIEIDGFLDHYTQNKDTLIAQKELVLETDFDINKGLFFNQIESRIGLVSLEGNGQVLYQEKDPNISFSIKSKNLSITDILPWIPKSSFDAQTNKSSGTINAQASISGTASKPNGNINFSLKDGTFSRTDYPVKLANINTKGQIFFGNKEEVKIPSLTAELDQQQLMLQFNLKDYSNPTIDLAAKGKLNLAMVGKLAGIEQKLGGLADVDIKYNGLVKSLSNTATANKWNGEGKVILENVSIYNKEKDKILDEVNGSIDVKSNVLKINALKGLLAGSPFKFTGNISPIATYLFTDNDQLKVSGELISTKIDYDKLSYILRDESTSNAQSSFHFPKNLKMQLKCSIKEFRQGKFKGQNIKGLATLSNNVLKLSNIQIEYEKGKLMGNLSISQLSNGNFVPRGYFSCVQIPIQKLMYSFDNFSQDEITSQNLSGYLDAEVNIAGVWDEFLNCQFPSLFAQLKLNISEGRLKNYEPLIAMSKFVNVKELMDIQFEPISQNIEIKDNWMYLSPMELKNNAINLAIISGKHSLDNDMDYHFRLVINQLLSSKYNLRKNRDQELYTNTSDGGMKLFIHMYGNGDDLKFKYDKQNTIKVIKESVKKERQIAKNIIKEELGLKVADSLKQKPKHIDVEWDE